MTTISRSSPPSTHRSTNMTTMYTNSSILSSKDKTPAWKSSLNDIRGTLEANRGSASVVEQIQSKQRESLNDRIRTMRMSLAEEPKRKKKFRMPTLAISKGTPIITALNNAQRIVDLRKSQTLPSNQKLISPNFPEEDQLTVSSSTTSSTLSEDAKDCGCLPESQKSSAESERQIVTNLGVSTFASVINSGDDTIDGKSTDDDAGGCDDDDDDDDDGGDEDGGSEGDDGDEDDDGKPVISKITSVENIECVDNDNANTIPSSTHLTCKDETSPNMESQPPEKDSPIFKSSFTFVPFKMSSSEPGVASQISANQYSPIEFNKFEIKNCSNRQEDSNKTNHPFNNISHEPVVYPNNNISYSRNCYQIFLKNRPQQIRAHTEPPGYPSSIESTTPNTKRTQVLKSFQSNEMNSDDVREVVVNKGPFSLGFCIEGGRGSPLGDQPIRVKRLFKGDTSVKGILEPGDVITMVNDQPMEGLTHFQAWNLLKMHSEGKMVMKIKKGIKSG